MSAGDYLFFELLAFLLFVMIFTGIMRDRLAKERDTYKRELESLKGQSVQVVKGEVVYENRRKP